VGIEVGGGAGGWEKRKGELFLLLTIKSNWVVVVAGEKSRYRKE